MPWLGEGFDPENAIRIRDAVFERIFPLTINGAPIKSGRRVPIVTVQPEQLPALGVFVLSENDVQDGDVSLPQFVTNLELGISLVIMADSDAFLDGCLDRFVVDVKKTLLKDPSFLRHLEYVTEVNREYSFAKEGKSYIAEIKMRLKTTYRTRYEPWAPYELKLVDLKTEPHPGTPVIEQQIILPPAWNLAGDTGSFLEQLDIPTPKINYSLLEPSGSFAKTGSSLF